MREINSRSNLNTCMNFHSNILKYFQFTRNNQGRDFWMGHLEILVVLPQKSVEIKIRRWLSKVNYQLCDYLEVLIQMFV